MNWRHTIAYRNNNPANIRRNPANNWVGRDITYNGASGFERFLTTTFGIRATIRILRTYHNRGIVTIDGIIRTFAPPVGTDHLGRSYTNPTIDYISFVASRSGFSAFQRLEFNEGTYFLVIRAMCLKESQYRLSRNEFATAWAMAF